MQGPTFIRTAVCSVIRVTGKVFDRFGQLFELEPVIERCKHKFLLLLGLCNIFSFFFLFFRVFSTTFVTNCFSS
jgi:hypothetical protein